MAKDYKRLKNSPQKQVGLGSPTVCICAFLKNVLLITQTLYLTPMWKLTVCSYRTRKAYERTPQVTGALHETVQPLAVFESKYMDDLMGHGVNRYI